MSSNYRLERAILETLAYSDIFNFPLRLDELRRYLPVHVDGFDLLAALARLEGFVGVRDGFYFLAGREVIVDIRHGREAPSRRAFRRALFYGRVLSGFPFVRMVGITGSLAVLNCDQTADLDFMLVAKAGRVWLARAFALLLNRIARLFGNTICPNLIISERALVWAQRDLYSAREICQMVLVAGEQVYSALRGANRWTESFLPNAPALSKALYFSNPIAQLVQRILERPLRGKFGDRLEAWERDRKIARFTRQAGYGTETVFNAEVCQGNFDHHGAQTRRAFEIQLRKLGLQGPVRQAPLTEAVESESRPAV